jgi:hypothetical protein
MVAKMAGSEPTLERKPGGPDNWVEKTGGLPPFIEKVAKDLHYDKGMSISHAIATAVSQCKKWCAKGNAKACAAIAQWEKNRAKTRINATDITGRKLSDFEFAEIIAAVGYRFLDLAVSAKIKSAGPTARPQARKVRSAPNRAPGASGSNKPFDESKYLRNPGNGKFSAKYTPAELIAGRRVVEGGVTNLQVGQTFKLPGDAGWVKRSSAGYLVQGPAGISVVARTLSEAVQAAANIMAGKLSRVGEVKK